MCLFVSADACIFLKIFIFLFKINIFLNKKYFKNNG